MAARHGRSNHRKDEPSAGTAAERGVFLAAVATTFVAEQLLWDGQFITYPMFKRIRDLDERHFVSVHQA